MRPDSGATFFRASDVPDRQPRPRRVRRLPAASVQLGPAGRHAEEADGELKQHVLAAAFLLEEEVATGLESRFDLGTEVVMAGLRQDFLGLTEDDLDTGRSWEEGETGWVWRENGYFLTLRSILLKILSWTSLFSEAFQMF